MSIGRITWFNVTDYCDRLELDDDQRTSMHIMIEKMDKAYLDHWSRKTKK